MTIAAVFSPTPRSEGPTRVASFFVQGKAVAQPRPQAVKNRGFAKVIEAPDSHKIHDWKHALRFEAKAAMGGRLPVEGVSLRVELLFLFDRPAALTKPKWLDKFVLVTNGKDVDNLAKSVMDSFNALIWKDDRIVSTLLVRKQYVMPGQAPGVHVGVFIDAPEPIPFWP